VNPIFLSGFGVSLNVDGAKLMIKDGHIAPNTNPSIHEIKPRHVPFDSIIIDSQTGQISISAIKWLMRHGVPLFILDYNGTLLSSVIPKEPITGNLKKAQFEAYQDAQRRFHIAEKLVGAKIERTSNMIEWFETRYEIDEKDKRRLEDEIRRFESCESLRDLLFVEGRVAEIYWKIFQTLIPKEYGFISRTHETHQMNSTDPVNTLLNYGYGFLESRCRASINTVGLEPSIGFLHEIAQPKHPLAYDLQEPFRWLVDTTILRCVENETFGKSHFFLTDNYVLRLEPSAIRKLLEELRISFNSKVWYKGKNHSWDTILQLKMQELARYLLARTGELDFRNPCPEFDAGDCKILREKILSLAPSQSRKIGISKSTLWYLQNRSRSPKTLRIYRKTANKVVG